MSCLAVAPTLSCWQATRHYSILEPDFICGPNFLQMSIRIGSRNSARSKLVLSFLSVLKPWQNKKGQTFVGMLVFYMSLFLQQAALSNSKKKNAKNEHPKNVWPILFCQSFIVSLNVSYKPILSVSTCRVEEGFPCA